MSYLIELSKERFKFSASHFTIFDSKEAEALHGHNYRLMVAIETKKLSTDTGIAFSFRQVKNCIEKLCSELDEKILLPKDSPYVQITEDKKQIEVRFHDRFYSFPITDCHLLPLINISSEELSRYCGEYLENHLDIVFLSLKTTIQETSGQQVSYQIMHK